MSTTPTNLSPLEQLMGTGANNAPAPSSTPSPLEQLMASKPAPEVPIANQPASLSGVLETLKPGNGGLTAAVKGATTDLLQGFGEGALQTVHGTGELIRKGVNALGDAYLPPGTPSAKLGDKLIPQTGQNALQNIATPDAGTAQQVGKTAEDIAEFVAGDEALKGLSVADRALKAAKLAERYEKASGFAKAAMDAVFSGTRQGAVAGLETTAKTGSPTEGAEAAITGAAAGTALSGLGKGLGAIRDIYRPLETAEAVQTTLQPAIRDVASKVAADAGVSAPSSTSIRDVVADLADSVKQKSQPIFQQIDELSNGKFSDAQAEAARYRGSLDSVGKEKFADAMQRQQDVFDSVKDRMDPSALDTAKQSWKRYNALSDVSDAIQKSVSGTRPEIAAASQAAQPTEAVNPKQLAAKLNALYDKGILQTALGNDGAHALLDHAGSAQQKLVSIADALNAQRAKQRVIKSVAIRTGTIAGGTALGGSAIAHGVKEILGHK